MLKKLDAAVEWAANWILVITGVIVCGMVFCGAFMRYVLHEDFYGSEELILLVAFWMYFVGSAMASKHDTQIKAEMLGLFIQSRWMLRIAGLIRCVVNLLVAAMATIWSAQYVFWNIDMHVKSSVFRFPVVYAVIPIAISFLLWTVYSIRDLVNCVYGIRAETTVQESKGE